MTASTEIWPAFFKTSAMLVFVIAILVLVFYLVKKFSIARGIKGSDKFIKVLCVHYLSPKEKLVLLDVMDEKILIGVTSQTVSRIATIDKDLEYTDKSIAHDDGVASGFSGMLAKAINFHSPGNLQKKQNSGDVEGNNAKG